MKRLRDDKSEDYKSEYYKSEDDKSEDYNLKKDFIYLIEPGEEGPCKYIESFCALLFFDYDYDQYTYDISKRCECKGDFVKVNKFLPTNINTEPEDSDYLYIVTSNSEKFPINKIYKYTEIPDYSVIQTEKKENFLCDWEKNGEEYRKK